MKPARYVFCCKQLKLQHNTLAVITGEAAPKSHFLEFVTCGGSSDTFRHNPLKSPYK